MLGACDGSEEDRPYPASTRAMRHSSVMADRLWSMIHQERERVSDAKLRDRLTTNSEAERPSRARDEGGLSSMRLGCRWFEDTGQDLGWGLRQHPRAIGPPQCQGEIAR
jgi:hypothetical protein